MNGTGKKILAFIGKVVAFILIAAGVIVLLAERMQETSFVNFIRSLI